MPDVLSYAGPTRPKPNSNDSYDLKVIAIFTDILGVAGLFGPILGLTLSDDPSMRLPLILMLIGTLSVAASGLFIHCRRLRIFSLIIAALLCLMFPLGTILGISTLRILSRDTVIALYRQPREKRALSS